jgi:hypothetical protein
MADDDNGHWEPDRIHLMATLCDTDIAAFLLLAKAIHPDELRSVALRVGIEGVDSLRELTIQVTCRARDLDDAAELKLRQWIRGRDDAMRGNPSSTRHNT